MKLLLDTHIWLWSLRDPARLTRRVARALESQKNELWLSPLSVWELLLLAGKGRISLSLPPEEWAVRTLELVPIKETPLTFEVALATRQIHLPHRDPVDIFLAATARAFDLTLVTADQRLLEGKGFAVLPNR
jgi:PIN domain nuclease of toxin-antitoxin system